MEHRHPGTNFPEKAGLTGHPTEEHDSQESVDLGKLRASRGLKRNNSSASAASAPDEALAKSGGHPVFKVGDEVTVVKKMTWNLPTKSNPDYRKDLNVGLQGVIMGSEDSAKVVLKVDLKLPGAKKAETFSKGVSPENLQLTSTYDPAPADKPEPSASKGPAEDDSQVPKWLLGSSGPADVAIEDKWTSLLADDDSLMKTMYLRGRIATGLHALTEVLPKWTLKDLLVVNRRNDQGVWQPEVYTKRPFEAKELLLAPCSSQLKDTHLLGSGHAVVTLPKNGRGSHPDNLSLALDGRCRNLIASAGISGPDAHTGSIYWLVTKTNEPKEATLDLETMQWEQRIKVNIPGLVIC